MGGQILIRRNDISHLVLVEVKANLQLEDMKKIIIESEWRLDTIPKTYFLYVKRKVHKFADR